MYQLDYKQNEIDLLIQLIQLENGGEELRKEWVNIARPIALTPTIDLPKNTSVRLTGIVGKPIMGEKDFFYDRLDINEFKYGDLVTLEHLTYTLQAESSSRYLAHWLSSVLNCQIDQSMIIDEFLPMVDGSTPVPFTVRLNPLNWVICGNLDIVLKR